MSLVAEPTISANERLSEIESRLDRLERIALHNYMQIREVARYAYENFYWEVEGDEVKEMLKMHRLDDKEIYEQGLGTLELVRFKMRLMRTFFAETRNDVVQIAKELASAESVAVEEERAA